MQRGFAQPAKASGRCGTAKMHQLAALLRGMLNRMRRTWLACRPLAGLVRAQVAVATVAACEMEPEIVQLGPDDAKKLVVVSACSARPAGRWPAERPHGQR